MLTRARYLALIDAPAIAAAITRAEARTSGEIRVSVAPWFWGDVRRTAEAAFARLGMAATRERNGVLIFVVPARRRFAVIGDVGIHARVGDAFWAEVGARLSAAFRAGRYTEGLIAGIEALGEGLARSFPADPARNPDELPNAVVTLGRGSGEAR